MPLVFTPGTKYNAAKILTMPSVCHLSCISCLCSRPGELDIVISVVFIQFSLLAPFPIQRHLTAQICLFRETGADLREELHLKLCFFPLWDQWPSAKNNSILIQLMQLYSSMGKEVPTYGSSLFKTVAILKGVALKQHWILGK